jgi:hypothetical protein
MLQHIFNRLPAQKLKPAGQRGKTLPWFIPDGCFARVSIHPGHLIRMDDSKHGVGVGSDFSASASLKIAEEEGIFIFLITFFF